MKKIKILALVIVVIAALSGVLYFKNKYFNYNNTATYHLYAKAIDINAVKLYPQKIKKEYSRTPFYELIVSVKPIKKDISGERIALDYPEYVKVYLKPTKLVGSESSEIIKLADQIIGNEKNIDKVINKASNWINENIEYDTVYARNARVTSREETPAEEAIASKRGTSTQFASIFIALMRAKKIPTKFVMGHKFGASTQAWVEVYTKGKGWVSVEPYSGQVNLDNRYVKLFEGTDYSDFNVLYKDIGVGINKEY